MNSAHTSRTSGLEDPFSYYLPSNFYCNKITVHPVVCRDMTSCSSLAVNRRRHFCGTSGCSFSGKLCRLHDTKRHGVTSRNKTIFITTLSEPWMSQNWKRCLKKKATKHGPRTQSFLILFIRYFNFALRMDPQSRLVKTSSGTKHGKQNVAVRSSTNALHILEVQGSNPGTKIVFYAILKFTHDKTGNARIK